MKIHKTRRLVDGHEVDFEFWYDRSIRSWSAIALDVEGHQFDDAVVLYTRDEVVASIDSWYFDTDVTRDIDDGTIKLNRIVSFNPDVQSKKLTTAIREAMVIIHNSNSDTVSFGDVATTVITHHGSMVSWPQLVEMIKSECAERRGAVHMKKLVDVARAELGDDLGGFSAVALLADNYCEPIDKLERIVATFPPPAPKMIPALVGKTVRHADGRTGTGRVLSVDDNLLVRVRWTSNVSDSFVVIHDHRDLIVMTGEEAPFRHHGRTDGSCGVTENHKLIAIVEDQATGQSMAATLNGFAPDDIVGQIVCHANGSAGDGVVIGVDDEAIVAVRWTTSPSVNFIGHHAREDIYVIS